MSGLEPLISYVRIKKRRTNTNELNETERRKPVRVQMAERHRRADDPSAMNEDVVTAEQLTALASIGTFVVITASAIAAFVQLRHLRGSNELEALNDFRQSFESPEVQAAQTALPLIQERLKERSYRLELELTRVPEWALPAMPACRLFEVLGLYVKHGIVSRSVACDLWGPVVIGYWEDFAPMIVVMRRTATDALMENFEALACLCKRWFEVKRTAYPKGLPRIAPPDPWAAEDERAI